MLRFRTSEAVSGRNQRRGTTTAGGIQPPTDAGQHCDPCHHVTLMASTGEERDRHLWSLHKETGSRERVPKPLILALPVDSARTFVGFDIHFIMIHINLGNVHFKVIGQELDGLPNSSYPGPTRRLKHLLQWWQVCACSCRERKGVRRAGRNPMPRQTDNAESQHSLSPHHEPGGLPLPMLLAGGGSGRIQTSTAGSNFLGHHPASGNRAIKVQSPSPLLCCAATSCAVVKPSTSR